MSAPCPTSQIWRFKVGGLVVEERGERIGAGAEIGVIVGEIGALADHPDLEVRVAPALADAGVEHRRFLARIGADDHHAVGFIDPGDGRVEEVARAAPFGIEHGAVLAAVEVRRAELPDQLLEREHLLDAAEVAGDGADPRRAGRLHLGGDGAERLRPRRRLEPAVEAHIGLVEALDPQAVDDVARLVGNPLLVHLVVDARQDAHHLAAAGVDADRRADGVLDVEGFGLAELPGPGDERIGLGGERAHRAEIDHVALQLRGHRLLRDRS